VIFFRGLARQVVIIVLICTLFVCAAILLIDFHITESSNDFIYNTIELIPERHVAIVLGTSKYVGKRKNQFYFHRITATVNLYKSSKIEAILVSGDNGTPYYNEPLTMQQDLIKQGIPKQVTTLDYAGFRTFDSMIRAQRVFGQSSFIIVSQRFHLQRALYIARNQGIDAIGFVAKDAEQRWHWRVRFREIFARVKMWLDLYILDAEPRFLGDEVEIKLFEGPMTPAKEVAL